jgi:uncharacterized protein Yka (UPF0111/DUF47 family)
MEDTLDWIALRSEPGNSKEFEMKFSLKIKIFHLKNTDPVKVINMVRITETIGFIADHAENAGDMMRAMIAG